MSESSTYYPALLREEELKNKVAKDWFASFDATRLLWVGALILVLCGCEKRQTTIVHGKPVGAIKRTVEKLSCGGEGWGWVQYPEIKREVLAITNVAERAQAVLASAELIASMNLLGLP